VHRSTPPAGILAYIPGAIYTAALADFVANVLNRYTGFAAPAPRSFGWSRMCSLGFARPWLRSRCARAAHARRFVGQPRSVVTARHERFGDAGNFERAIVYTSTQAHHSGGESRFGSRAFPRRTCARSTSMTRFE